MHVNERAEAPRPTGVGTSFYALELYVTPGANGVGVRGSGRCCAGKLETVGRVRGLAPASHLPLAGVRLRAYGPSSR